MLVDLPNNDVVYYLRPIFDMEKRTEVIDKAVARLKIVKETVGFQAIAFRGLSGAIIVPAVAEKLGVGMIAVRKPNDCSHSERRVEGAVNCDYIIIDDLISTGQTIQQIVGAINKEHRCKSTFRGAYLYCPPKLMGSHRLYIERDLKIDILNEGDW